MNVSLRNVSLSHIVNMSRGVDKASEKNVVDKLRLLSINWLIRGNHRILTIKLCIVVLIQITLGLESQISGMSIIVEIMSFSIGEGLGFGHSLFHRW